jgi:hypothetical protein
MTPLVLALALATNGVECPAPKEAVVGSLAHRGTEERLAFLSTRFVAESEAAQRWTGVWGGSYIALIGVFPREEQPDWYWGALSSAVGVAFSVLDPLEVMAGGPVFARRAAAHDVNDAAATCALLAEGEKLLRASAEHEATGRSWFIHAGNVLFNVGIGLVLGLGYQRWTSAAINALAGAVIGELTIFTSPNQLISAWDSYVKADGAAHASVQVNVVPTLLPGSGAGLGVVIRF